MELDTPHGIGLESSSILKFQCYAFPNRIGYESHTRFPMQWDTNPNDMCESQCVSSTLGDSYPIPSGFVSNCIVYSIEIEYCLRQPWRD